MGTILSRWRRKGKTPKYKYGFIKRPRSINYVINRKRLEDNCDCCGRAGWVNRGKTRGKWLERLCICPDGVYRCLNCIPPFR